MVVARSDLVMFGTVARTALLMSALIALLAIGGWVFGGSNGMMVMIAIGLIINFLSYWFSDRIALMAHRAHPISREQAPELHAIVERLAARAGIPKPSVHLIPSSSPNAFATGRNPKHAAVAVTQGLLDLMDRRQLTGVLAHELSHVENRDILVATVAAGIAGVISSIGHVMSWGLMFGGSRDDRGGSALGAIAWIIVAPLIALLLQLAISRSREYGADSSGARLTDDPEGLAGALERLDLASRYRPYEMGGPATAHLFIVNPLRGRSVMSLLATHPPIPERVARLRAMR